MLSGLHRYPDAGGNELRNALAEHNGVDAACVTLGNGSVELIENTAKAFLEPGLEAVMAVPSFLKFRIATRLMGARTVEIPTVEDRVDLDAMAAAVGEQTRVVFLANPDNPTGQMVSADAVMRFIDSLPTSVVIYFDQAYFEYTSDQEPPLLPLIERGNVVVARTYSKAYGLAGLRIGYALGHPELIASLGRVREHFNTSSVAQRAALVALSDVSHMEHAVAENERERERLAAALRAKGLAVTPSFTNFLLVRPAARGPLASAHLDDALLQRGVIVRPMGFYGMSGAVRISVGSRGENDRLLEAISEIAP
jgi:histidinol-phosphate aminotransferase